MASAEHIWQIYSSLDGSVAGLAYSRRVARASRTDIAVLGALSVQPMSGYAVRAAITATLGHFWSESFGQIYPALARLEAAGLVRAAGDGRTSGRVFEITAAGLERLRALLAEPDEPAPPRNGLLLRLFFGRLLGPAVCRDLVLDVRDRATAALTTYAALRREIETDPDQGNRAYFLITVAAGEHGARAQLGWADEALALLAGVEQHHPTG
jgi:DNA-binding PadR family transcriptional regulator